MALSLKAWRKAKDMSLEKMADLLNIHVNTYSAWESEPQKIAIGKCVEIANILDVNFDDIIFLPENSTKM